MFCIFQALNLFFVYKKDMYDFQLILDNVIEYDQIKNPLTYFMHCYYLKQNIFLITARIVRAEID